MREKSRKSMELRIVVLVVVLTCVFGMGARPSLALTHGRVDTFSSGTTEGWVCAPANPVQPFVVPSGGPAGAGDGYVLVSTTGGGVGSALSMLNAEQWAGDYLQAGAAAFQMDCLNAGRSALVLRILICRVTRSGEATDVVVSRPVVLPPRQGWVPVVVSIALDDLTTLEGCAREALAGATEVRILHGVERTLPPAVVIGALGVDNFQAIGTPVPARTTSWGRIKGLYR